MKGKFHETTIVIPFESDPAIDGALAELRESLREFSPGKFLLPVCHRFLEALRGGGEVRTLHLCGRHCRRSVGGILHAPNARLRVDYRRLGIAAALLILHGGKSP